MMGVCGQRVLIWPSSIASCLYSSMLAWSCPSSCSEYIILYLAGVRNMDFSHSFYKPFSPFYLTSICPDKPFKRLLHMWYVFLFKIPSKPVVAALVLLGGCGVIRELKAKIW